MHEGEFIVRGNDGGEVHTYEWLPATAPVRGIVQISHGMAEHAGRYAPLGRYLAERGIAVFANDHKGHGKTTKSQEDIGFFAEREGWRQVLDDLHSVNQSLRVRYPDTPIILIGHSMGSMLARHYLALYGDSVCGAVLSGTAGDPGLIGWAGQLIAQAEAKLKGARAKSKLMNWLSFGSFNARFKPNRTEFDWLSRDEREVDRYIDDPHCGALFTASFYKDMLSGLRFIHTPAYYQMLPKSLPMLFISGSDDPVMAKREKIEKVVAQLKLHGLMDVTLRIYPDARHEIFNEINREEVFGDVYSWISLWISRYLNPEAKNATSGLLGR